ncbi:hypothetical protein APHHGE2_1407 [Anaplasma phagocytophilum str. HGE2]|nr:hypothetical protein APHHGE2_1407 [Anaplasma phagocytophilum str. HGE2]
MCRSSGASYSVFQRVRLKYIAVAKDMIFLAVGATLTRKSTKRLYLGLGNLRL